MIDFGTLDDPRVSVSTQGVQRLVERYSKILGHDDLSSPHIVVHNHLSSRWLGKTVQTFGATRTTIHLQKIVFADADTLARVVAHETIHHVQLMTDPPTQTQIKFNLWDGHGIDFFRMAAKINEVEGKDFVTKTSDSSYALAARIDRNVYMFIRQIHGKATYQIAARLTPKMMTHMKRFPGRLVKLLPGADAYWTDGRPPRIGSKRYAIPEGPRTVLLEDLLSGRAATGIVHVYL